MRFCLIVMLIAVFGTAPISGLAQSPSTIGFAEQSATIAAPGRVVTVAASSVSELKGSAIVYATDATIATVSADKPAGGNVLVHITGVAAGTTEVRICDDSGCAKQPLIVTVKPANTPIAATTVTNTASESSHSGAKPDDRCSGVSNLLVQGVTNDEKVVEGGKDLTVSASFTSGAGAVSDNKAKLPTYGATLTNGDVLTMSGTTSADIDQPLKFQLTPVSAGRTDLVFSGPDLSCKISLISLPKAVQLSYGPGYSMIPKITFASVAVPSPTPAPGVTPSPDASPTVNQLQETERSTGRAVAAVLGQIRVSQNPDYNWFLTVGSQDNGFILGGSFGYRSVAFITAGIHSAPIQEPIGYGVGSIIPSGVTVSYKNVQTTRPFFAISASFGDIACLIGAAKTGCK